MKAAIRKKYCLPDQIKIDEVKDLVPQDREVLIKVHTTTVSRTDCATLTAQPFIMRFLLGFFKPRKIVLGTDFAGEVIAVGKLVQSFKVGDRVFGFNDEGAASQAEYMLSVTDTIFPIPKKISYEIAAASVEGAHYAYSFINKVDLQAGQQVLIHGATGAIGSALLQFVRQYDVKITATSTTNNMELVYSLGADKIYDYSKTDFTEQDDRYDFIFDAVGKSTYSQCKHLLKERGIYMSSELGPYSQNVFYPFLTIFSRKKVVFPAPYSIQETIPYISNLLKNNKFSPVIDRAYALDNIAEAYEYVLTGNKTGNVIMHVNDRETS